ncbi:MAG: leucine--tRNA ligase [Deltaproteobacteria bacterium]|nr:MAG: leucine--tRNA ligase [Deltaproteobacteria bacterium]
MAYDHLHVESKWQRHWKDQGTYLTSQDRTRPKYYVLDMFPYPSGSGLHVGHPKGYVATDVVARARRMMGYNVLRVMGWDSFGLPAERQAEREGRHPREITERNITTFKGQLSRLGLSYDWSRELATSEPEYYKWTQWIFLQLYRRGLAYQAEVPVNWCPALGTVLANEEVVDGRYVETGDVVERRLMKQWMLKITDYAESLLAGLDTLDWPEGIKAMQREWIGRSEGARFTFEVADHDASFEVFTTRPDTLFGCTYTVLAPEHPLVSRITTEAQRQAVAAYLDEVSRRSERDRTSQAADAPKTGVFTGAYAVHPITGEKVPIWIADYVLAHYGTGAVFACPAHDERDHAFAKTFDLPILEVVSGGEDVQQAAFPGSGPHVNSDFLDGLDNHEAIRAVVAWLEAQGKGEGTVQYRLRDWLFSRQRYWGEPFPLIELEDGTVRALSEGDLPVLLPDLDAFKPTADGQPPLARAREWVQTTDPMSGASARRETNTMPQWAGSCWYYLRFISPDRSDVAWDSSEEAYWMPVDLYVGGAEHAVLHLLYARFWHHVLHDLGLVSTREPFQRLFNQGMVHATGYNTDPDMRGRYAYPSEVRALREGGEIPLSEANDEDHFEHRESGERLYPKLMKMSKSRYNVVNPDDMCEEYGADAMRLYELFMGPLDVGAHWETSGVAGTRRFLDRADRLVRGDVTELVEGRVADAELDRALHSAIKQVTEAVESLRFNTAISEMMIFVNVASKAAKVGVEQLSAFVRLLAPFAPHLAEELWEQLGHPPSVVDAAWPEHDPAKLVLETVEIAVQVNGKVRGRVTLPTGASKEQALEAARAEPNVARQIEGKSTVKEIVVPGRLVNLVVR